MTEELIMDFNNEVANFANVVSALCPTSMISNNIDYFHIVVKKYPNFIIDQFSIHVLQYKEMIDSQNEDFFLKSEFAKETKGDANIINQVFEMKNVWKVLSDENKKGVFLIMQVLCYYAEQYCLDKINNIDKNKN